MDAAAIPASEKISMHDQGPAVSNRLKCPLAAKQYGYEDVLAPLIAKACVSVCPKNPINFNVDNVRTIKIPGAAPQLRTKTRYSCHSSECLPINISGVQDLCCQRALSYQAWS